MDADMGEFGYGDSNGVAAGTSGSFPLDTYQSVGGESVEENGFMDYGLPPWDSEDDGIYDCAQPTAFSYLGERVKVDGFSYSPRTDGSDKQERISAHTLESAATQLTRNRSPSLTILIPEDNSSTSTLHSETTLYLSNMSSLKRTRDIKAQITSNPPTLHTQGPKRGIKEDSETQIIRSLRQDQHMKFVDIAHYLNRERRKRGEAAEWTEPAVYSRLVRHAPKIATAMAEIGFDPRDYMHLRNPTQYADAGGEGTVSKAGRKRVKNYDNATELRANVRVKLDLDAELETAQRSEQLVLAVAKVERNFWVLVADEMERVTTRLYRPEVLAARYHSL